MRLIHICQPPLIFGPQGVQVSQSLRRLEMVILPEPDVETLDVLYIADDQALAEMYRLKLELDGYWVRVGAA